MAGVWVAAGARHRDAACPEVVRSGEAPIRLAPGGRWQLAAARVLPRCPACWSSGPVVLPGEGETPDEDDRRLVAALQAAARGGRPPGGRD
ncbi:MAG: hypothetical protein MUE51_11870 [Thermoleophilia bacterium]|jgi:hypothetical protein|nr:hypothetical protein [Thermoleophilia bacterium]